MGKNGHNTLKLKIMLCKARLKNFEIKKNKPSFYLNNHSPNIFPVLINFTCVRAKFPVFSLSGKSKNQIPCFPCAVATLKKDKQECIPVGCIPATRRLYSGVCFPGGCLPGPGECLPGLEGGVCLVPGVWSPGEEGVPGPGGLLPGGWYPSMH